MAAALFSLLLAACTTAPAPAEEAQTFPDSPEVRRITGYLKGADTADHRFRIRSGSQFDIGMTSPNRALRFKLLPPGSKWSVFSGSPDSGRHQGTAAKSGEYTVRVYLTRSAARRDETAAYDLEIITGARAAE